MLQEQIAEQINGLVRVSSQAPHDSLQISHIYEASLVAVEHVEDATEVLELLLGIESENVDFGLGILKIWLCLHYAQRLIYEYLLLSSY